MRYDRNSFLLRASELYLENLADGDLVELLTEEIGIKGDVAREFICLIRKAHSGENMVGPKPSFNSASSLAEEVTTTYYITIGELEKTHKLV